MYRRLKQLLIGETFPQEYLCFARGDFANGFRVELQSGSNVKDVTDSNIMLGYSPLIIGIINNSEDHEDVIKLNFTFKGDIVSFLVLNFVHSLKAGNETLLIYKGVKGSHKLLSQFRKTMIGTRQFLRSFKKGNVRLKGNIYDQVRISYSIPREISIVTTGKGNLYNMFPTDLHGRINNQYYMDSLRFTGKACKQTEETGKVIISRVDAGFYRQAYALGKNHMTDMKEKDNSYKAESEILKLPVPDSAISYLELERISSIDEGIHRIHLFSIINEKIINPSGAYLSHIHNYAASWRERNGIKTNYLIR